MKPFPKTLLFAGLFALAFHTFALDAATDDAPAAESSAARPTVLAPFYTKSEFKAPAVGTYTLPALRDAGDGEVLDTDGKPRHLHDFMGKGKVVLLSFVYSHCTDINGCPLATAVLYSIQQKIQNDPQLRGRLRMLSLSFDPKFDTPEVMKLYGAGFGDEGDWQFLTTKSLKELDPIMEDYGQSMIRDVDENGELLPSFSHILRVFLIDPEKRIRNIYSVSFLDPDLIVNDAKTILLDEKPVSPPSALAQGEPAPPRLSRPGDDKTGYDTGDYVTDSQSVTGRVGKETNLMKFVEQPPLGLPRMEMPADNPVTPSKVALGRKLFYDRRLSINDTFSCAICHVAEQGFTNHELSIAVGVEGRSGRRNTPTIYNVGYLKRLFHDGREDKLEQQVWAPLLAHNEMANPSIGYVVNKIKGIPEYQGLFEAAFDGRGPGMETIGMALASYERTLASGGSAFDRWYYGKDENAMSESAKRGFSLFTGKAGCSSCHTVGEKHALFTDDQMHNTGSGYRESMGIKPPKERVALAPGVFVEVDRDIIDAVGAAPPADVGLYEVTENPFDRWKYHTPSLRNVALTAPYMHNGSLATLHDVVRFYNEGGVPNKLLDPRVRPLHLDDGEVDDLVAFMRSLTGDNVDELVSDAFAAPVGDLTEKDPNWAHGTPYDD